MSEGITITVPAADYRNLMHDDDCLAAAEADAREKYGLPPGQWLAPRWLTWEREEIELTLPAEAVPAVQEMAAELRRDFTSDYRQSESVMRARWGGDFRRDFFEAACSLAEAEDE